MSLKAVRLSSVSACGSTEMKDRPNACVASTPPSAIFR